jgi:response regulator of citrate/malate metabolism
VLTKAGFTSASILGFDWEKQLEESTKDTEQANLEVQKLNLELGAHAAEVEEVAKQVTEPAAKKKADDLALRLRASQTTARRIGAQLGRNLTVQRELQNEFRRKIPPHSP